MSIVRWVISLFYKSNQERMMDAIEAHAAESRWQLWRKRWFK
jgi:hypothetical protein